jgi:hypothetical protein
MISNKYSPAHLILNTFSGASKIRLTVSVCTPMLLLLTKLQLSTTIDNYCYKWIIILLSLNVLNHTLL